MERAITFLVVEDDDSHAMITSRSLKSNECVRDIHRVSDGAEAIEFLKGEGGFASRTLPDLILLDLKLPKMNGHEVLQWLKGQPELHAIPVIILTTSNAPEDRLLAYQHHANSYLVKPSDFQKFKAMTSQLIEYWGHWNQPVDPTFN